jgi:hypothetical protein
MIELFDRFLTIMFATSFWHFLGSIIVLLIFSALFEWIVEHFFTFIQVLLRGYPVVNNYITKKDDNKEEKKSE